MRREYSSLLEGVWFYAAPFVCGGVLVGVSENTYLLIGAILFFAFGCFALYFFRDPQRIIPDGRSDVVSPADGKVVATESLKESPYYRGPCQRVSIFLSVFNVHVNRVPVAGRIARIEYKKGKFLNAMAAESGEQNESNTVYIEGEHGAFVVRQIAGLIARRIVCVAKENDQFERGEKFGMIRFGSRTEVYLPPDSEICVKIGDKVEGGASVLARTDTRRTESLRAAS